MSLIFTKSTRKAKALRNLKVTRVDLVDKGASIDPETGQGAHVVLFKRDPTADDSRPGNAPTCKECGENLSAGAKFCGDCGAKVAVAKAARSVVEISAAMLDSAVKKGMSLSDFLARDPEGHALWQEMCAAAGPSSEDVEKGDGTTIRDLRRAALEEEERDTASQHYSKMVEVAGNFYPHETSVAKKLEKLSEHRDIFGPMYRQYSNAMRTRSAEARTRFAKALADELVESLAEPLHQDGSAKSRAESRALALKLCPSLAHARTALITKASNGAPVADVESAVVPARGIVEKLLTHGREAVKKAAGGVEGEHVKLSKAITMAVEDRPGLRAAVQSADPGALKRSPWSLAKMNDRATYEEYRQSVLEGEDFDGDDAA